MQTPEPQEGRQEALARVLGYINFSSGTADPQFYASLNSLYAELYEADENTAWRQLGSDLTTALGEFKSTGGAFSDTTQAEAVLRLVWDELIPAYLEFQAELLFHQTPEQMCGPFFLGQMIDAVLLQGGPWDENTRIVEDAVRHLSDFVGYRPIPTLEGHKAQTYAHERVRPVPIYLQGAGVVAGSRVRVLTIAIDMLQNTDDDICRAAHFYFENLGELSYDPRSYDFDHPVNKRPNYHFGQWDPDVIDNRGFYRRFVVQEVTLDALMRRVTTESEIPQEELEYEAAAVLAGTILMASGISGSGPDTHDSNVSLALLLPSIAGYRDQFYERLLHQMTGEHAQRLQLEAAEKRQPFGSARQHLNAQLARRRASQLEHVHLARIFAGMGFPEAATSEAEQVATTSARMVCQIECLLSNGHRAIDEGDLESGIAAVEKITERLHTGIECGAIVDPWNILGFDGNFSLFPSIENSVRDHRVDELLVLMEHLFAFCSRVWSESAARDKQDSCQQIAARFTETAEWWRQFAAHEISNVEGVDSMDAYRAAEHVAEAMNLWHKGGAAAGDVKFWAPHADMFDSPKAYAMVIQALLDQGDFVASMALLIHWLGQAERIGLERGASSFHRLAESWLSQMLPPIEMIRDDQDMVENWNRVRRCFDYLEANAEEFWNVPRFELNDRPSNPNNAQRELEQEEEEGPDELFEAAYENMVYHDTTDDGVDSQLFDDEDTTHDELLSHSKAIAQKLAFLSCLAKMWKYAAIQYKVAEQAGIVLTSDSKLGDWNSALHRWNERAADNVEELKKLLDEVHRFRIPDPTGTHESMLEYDRRQMVKESLLERIITTCVEMANARLMLHAAIVEPIDPTKFENTADTEDAAAVLVISGLLCDDGDRVADFWEELRDSLAKQPLLYVPLARNGDPQKIVVSRIRQQLICDLLAWLPRQAFMVESCELLETARNMERDNPVGPGAVTEFDELFKIGYKSLIESVVVASYEWPDEIQIEGETATREEALVSCLERVTESLLLSWLAHSRTLRLSVLERVLEAKAWERIVDFIRTYGEDLFTQRFLNLGNLRAILHQGCKQWLQQLRDENLDESLELKLISELGTKISLQQAGESLTLILEAIVENYGEYRDYNSTTTQSDRGDLLYTLLDFLRLRTKYDRVCWNLKPVIWAHAILVRRGSEGAARMWRRVLAKRVSDEAEQYLKELARLQKEYAMRMPTVADRLAERFVRPMVIDRICALVEPAMREASSPEVDTTPNFESLRHETDVLTREPTGVGLDVPAWIMALEDEVERVRKVQHLHLDDATFRQLVPILCLPLEEIHEEIDAWEA